MKLPPDLLHLSPQEAVRRIGLMFVREAREASRRLDDELDAEALHDFRVAIRRLRSTARSWRPELKGSLGGRELKALKKLQGATGAGRDAEVALEWLETQRAKMGSSHRRGFDWLVGRLLRRRRESMAHVRKKVKRDFDAIDEELVRRLEVMTVKVRLGQGSAGPVFGSVLADRLRGQLDELLKTMSHVRSVHDGHACHETRIAAKRLRYLAEPIRDHVEEAAGVVKLCKRLQDVLGDLNDAHVLTDELGTALEVTAVEHARRLRALARDDDEEELRRETRRAERPGLLELTRRVQNGVRRLFERFEKDWLSTGAAPLVAEVEHFAEHLDSITHTEEIERKYLLSGLPDFEALPETTMREIEQGYVPGDRLRERLRRSRLNGSVQYTRTLKLGHGVRRMEFEEDTDEQTFGAFWPLTEGARIFKRRYAVPDGDLVWEIDEYPELALVVAEVELPSADVEPELPYWLADLVVRDVTDDGRYSNLSLAERPDDAPRE